MEVINESEQRGLEKAQWCAKVRTTRALRDAYSLSHGIRSRSPWTGVNASSSRSERIHLRSEGLL